MNIQESGEMYLETIYVLNKKSGNVRSIDVCEYLGYSKPSVSRAMSLLKNGGYVLMDSDGFLTLTDAGLEIAEKIAKDHLSVREVEKLVKNINQPAKKTKKKELSNDFLYHDMEEKVYFSLENPAPEIDPQTHFISV